MKTQEIEYRCGCQLCCRHRDERENRDSLGFQTWPDEAKKYIIELDNNTGELEDHIDYLESIINGNWPTADECIKAAREKDRTKEFEEYNKKYSRWQIKVDGQWVRAERTDDGEFKQI